ncbi:MAG: oligosaccharide flippase family protein [Taibaiella sp.]|jgi:O-antigen/teichoic acid export membrane protein
MTNEKSSYKAIIKATSIFGGVQVFTILLSIIKAKTVALWLGPSGMGVIALLTSATGLISNISNFGLSNAAVKNIAASNNSGNQINLARTTKVFKLLVWGTGLLGMFIVLIFSNVLSKLNFGDSSYVIAFCILSLTVLFNQLTQGYLAILQGTQRLKLLAKSSLLGAFIGSAIIITIYYFYREKGIVTSLLVTSAVPLLIAVFYSAKVKLPTISISFKDLELEGSNMLKMGFLISMTGLLSQAVYFLIRLFITRNGSVSDVGLYSSGFTIVSTYFGMIFTAMGTDYYPRLSAIAGDREKANKEINYQAEIAILIIAPLLTIFLIFIKYGIIILYSEAFVNMVPMMRWAVMGIMFQAFSWSIAFIFLAKGDSKTYFWNEVIALTYFLALNVVFYKILGFAGLGTAFMINYIVYSIHMFGVAKIKYGFKLAGSLNRDFTVQLICVSLGFLITQVLTGPIFYIAGVGIILISSTYSIIILNKRMGIQQSVRSFLNRKNGK